MKRRSFILASSLLGASPSFAAAALKNQQKKSMAELYELRTYTVKDQQQQNMVEDYFNHAAIPALNQSGSKVGFFTELKPEGQTKIFALISHRSIEDFFGLEEKLSKNKKYLDAAAAYLNAPATEPAYVRIESSLLRSIHGMPTIAVPEKKPRIFELRRYESSGEAAAKKKIEMFNEGEIDIFKKTGLTPVFFGETIIGPLRPNLTYMLQFDDMEDHDRSWKTFVNDPAWKKISAIPDYADAKIVSRITSTMLAPAAFSQV